MGNLTTKILIFTGIAAIIIAVMIGMKPADKVSSPPNPVFASDPTPSPSQVTAVQSPDGKATLIMKEKKVEGGNAYTLFTTSEKDPSQKEVFTKTIAEGGITIPFNTFSPDNKYVLLMENLPAGTRYFVLALAGGETFEASDLFNEKFSPDYTIKDMTGWGGINLVIINTRKADGADGPSFWFEVPSRAFIRLSHSF